MLQSQARALADSGVEMARIHRPNTEVVDFPPGATIDGDPRPRKDPRPLVLPVDVPNDVRLSFAPGGGLPEVRALLHEMGAAVYYAHVQSARVEYPRLDGLVPREPAIVATGADAIVLGDLGCIHHELRGVDLGDLAGGAHPRQRQRRMGNRGRGWRRRR